MIQVACPHCKSVFSTAPANAGREVACPRCSGRLGVPAMTTASLTLGVSVLCPHCRKVFNSSIGRPGDTVSCAHCARPVEIPGGGAARGTSAAKAFLWIIVLLIAASAGAIWVAMREKETPAVQAPPKPEKESPKVVAEAEPKPTKVAPLSAFAAKMKEGEAALLQGDADQARAHFQAAYELNPQDRTVQETLKALQDYQAARGHLAKAGDALRAGDMTALLSELRKAGDFLDADFQKTIDKQKPLKVLLDKSGGEIETILTTALARVQTPAKAHKDRADEAWRKLDYPTAAAEYARAAQEMAKAKSLFPSLKALAPARLRQEIETKEQEVTEQLATLDRAAKKGEGHVYFKKGRDLLLQGKLQMVEAELDGRAVFKAQKAFAAALKEFQEAGKFPETNAKEQIDSAHKELLRADRMLEPVAFNIPAQQLPAEWTYFKKQWNFLKKADRTWLQAAETPEATLTSPTLVVPSNFELELTLAMIDRNSEIQNDYWGATRDALTMTLGSKTKDLVIALGKDPAVIGQNHTRLAVGKRTVDAQHLANTKQPFTLRLRRHKDSAAVSLGAKEDVIVLPLPDEFNQFKLTVRNGYNKATNQYFAFPVLLSVSMKMHLEDQPAAKTR